MDRALTRRVLLATATTLIAPQGRVHGWRQEAVSKNAERSACSAASSTTGVTLCRNLDKVGRPRRGGPGSTPRSARSGHAAARRPASSPNSRQGRKELASPAPVETAAREIVKKSCGETGDRVRSRRARRHLGLVRPSLPARRCRQLVAQKDRVEFRGGYAVRFDGDGDRGNYLLGAANGDRGLTLVRPRGPNAGRHPAIYQLVGDRLRICYGSTGETPTRFATTPDSRSIS